MKVLLIGNISDTIILFRQHLIIKLIEKGNSVYTLTMDNNPDNFARIRKYGAIPKSYFFSRSGINPFVDIINTYKLSKEIKNIKPDIVLCFFPKPVIYGTIAAKIAGVKSIYNLLE
ncbi:glycosyltransferase family 1 protein, partial [Salmonella enterica subsp. salamae]|nr:glycosyltransferase family 1 protein [Salmonella enterica subsp. salamae]